MTSFTQSQDRNIDFLAHHASWPVHLAPDPVREAIEEAGGAVEEHRVLADQVADGPDDVVMARALWEAKASRAVENGEPLPDKSAIEYEEIRLQNAKKKLAPAEWAATRAANQVGGTIREHAEAWQMACEEEAMRKVKTITDALDTLSREWTAADQLLRTSYLLQTGWRSANAIGGSTGASHLPWPGLAGIANDLRALEPWRPLTPVAAPTPTARTAALPLGTRITRA